MHDNVQSMGKIMNCRPHAVKNASPHPPVSQLPRLSQFRSRVPVTQIIPAPARQKSQSSNIVLYFKKTHLELVVRQ